MSHITLTPERYAELQKKAHRNTAASPASSPASLPPCLAKAARAVTRKRKATIPERDILAACLSLLAVHPQIALAFRVNSGAMQLDGRYIKFNSMPGISDIIAVQKRTGRLIAIEVKRKGKYPTPAQNQFLAAVNDAGGYGCYVQDVDRLAFLLEKLT